jgi:hypothetical protein
LAVEAAFDAGMRDAAGNDRSCENYDCQASNSVRSRHLV